MSRTMLILFNFACLSSRHITIKETLERKKERKKERLYDALFYIIAVKGQSATIIRLKMLFVFLNVDNKCVDKQYTFLSIFYNINLFSMLHSVSTYEHLLFPYIRLFPYKCIRNMNVDVDIVTLIC
jgi:hypothetical protein